MDKVLNPLLEKADALPFLFVGSGFSRRYLNIPTWENLLDKMAAITYSDKFQYIRIKAEASKKYNKETNYNDYMTFLCDLISNDLDKMWYTDDRFKSHREKYEELLLKQHVPPIKIEIAEYISSFDEYNVKYEHELQALKRISTHSISGIITTNYDNLLEDIFKYETYPSQEDLLFHSQYNVGEIYKIHGCVSKPDTVLINTADYQMIEEKHKYLSAKLLTIFVEHPILFVGYSIGDEDIRIILNDIKQCLSVEQLHQIKERLFYIVWDETVENCEDSTYNITFQDGSSLAIKQIRISDFSILYNTLAKQKSKYPIKLLRHAKQDMYNMILTNDPTERMVLSLPSDDLTPEELEQIEFIYGFGIMEMAKNGYGLVSTEEIYQDIVFNNKNFNPDLMVTSTLPYALLKSSGFLPIRKYTSQVESDKYPEIVQNNLLRFSSVNKILSHTLRRKKERLSVDTTFDSAINSSEKLSKLALVNYNAENIDLLGDFLKSKLDKDNFSTKNADYRRLIRIYDLVKHKKRADHD